MKLLKRGYWAFQAAAFQKGFDVIFLCFRPGQGRRALETFFGRGDHSQGVCNLIPCLVLLIPWAVPPHFSGAVQGMKLIPVCFQICPWKPPGFKSLWQWRVWPRGWEHLKFPTNGLFVSSCSCKKCLFFLSFFFIFKTQTNGVCKFSLNEEDL